jgi:hypothetical protein
VAAVATADAELRRGLSEDWKAALQRFPEVLDYFHKMIDSSLSETVCQSRVLSWDENKRRFVIMDGPLKESREFGY